MTIAMDLFPPAPQWLPLCLRGPTHIWGHHVHESVDPFDGKPCLVWRCLICAKVRPLVKAEPRCPLEVTRG